MAVTTSFQYRSMRAQGCGRPCCGSTALGAVLWFIAAMRLASDPSDARTEHLLILFAALVLIPFAWTLLGSGAARERGGFGRFWCAALLYFSFGSEPGTRAFLFALPWAAITLLMAVEGARRLFRYGPRPLARLSMDAGLLFALVGGAWLLLDRAGVQPFGFDRRIVLLTAVHFHYAGFVLTVIAGCVARESDDAPARVAALGIIAATPLVAAGITATQLGAPPHLEALAACLLAASAGLLGVLQMRIALARPAPHFVRTLGVVAGGALLIAMLFAMLYALCAFLPVEWLDIPRMREVHGLTNAFGFAVPALLYWTYLAGPPRSEPQPRAAPPPGAGDYIDVEARTIHKTVGEQGGHTS